MKKITGTGIALITPFKEDGNVDYGALEKLTERAIVGGIDYLVVMGTTAESVTLTSQEKENAIGTIKQTNAGRIPMVLGVGGNNTAEVVKQVKQNSYSDFAALLSVSPSYNKPTQEGIYAHFAEIARHTEQNIILYNVPSRTGSNMAPKTTLKLAKDFEHIVAIKEASPSFVQSTEIIKDAPDGFMVLSGDDEFALPMTLAGGKGVISVIAQALPELYTKMINFALEGKNKEAYAIHYKIMAITREIYVEGNPAGVKALLSLLDVCQPYTRLPLASASKKLTKSLQKLHKKVKK